MNSRPPPGPPAFRAPAKRAIPPPETAQRGADLCREAIGLPVKHTLPLDESEPEETNDPD